MSIHSLPCTIESEAQMDTPDNIRKHSKWTTKNVLSLKTMKCLLVLYVAPGKHRGFQTEQCRKVFEVA